MYYRFIVISLFNTIFLPIMCAVQPIFSLDNKFISTFFFKHFLLYYMVNGLRNNVATITLVLDRYYVRYNGIEPVMDLHVRAETM